MLAPGGCGPPQGISDHSRRVLERPDAEGEIPVDEIGSELGGTRVVPDTCNPV